LAHVSGSRTLRRLVPSRMHRPASSWWRIRPPSAPSPRGEARPPHREAGPRERPAAPLRPPLDRLRAAAHRDHGRHRPDGGHPGTEHPGGAEGAVGILLRLWTGQHLIAPSTGVSCPIGRSRSSSRSAHYPRITQPWPSGTGIPRTGAGATARLWTKCRRSPGRDARGGVLSRGHCVRACVLRRGLASTRATLGR